MSFVGDLRAAIGSAFCAGFETYDDVARFSAGLIYPDRVDDVYPLSPAGGIANTGIALFCDRPPLTPPPGGGSGRCATSYRLRAYITYRDRFTPDAPLVTELFGANDNNTYPGPLGEPVVSDNGQRFSIGFSNISGFITGPFYQGETPTFTLANERVDGLPDECGDDGQPVQPVPPEDRQRPIVVGDIDIDISIGNGNITIGGDLIVPINIDGPELTISGELNLNTGDINFNFGGTPTDPKCDDDKPDVDEPPPPAEDDEEEEEGEPTIVGVIVRSTTEISKLKATEVYQDIAPNIYAPKIGHVSFKIKVGDYFCWTSDIYVKNKNNYIQNPSRFPAVAVAGTPEKGVSWELTPVKTVPERYDLSV